MNQDIETTMNHDKGSVLINPLTGRRIIPGSKKFHSLNRHGITLQILDGKGIKSHSSQLTNHPQLHQWLKGKLLSPQTLIPVGLLKKVYQSYAQLAQPPKLIDLVDEEDLRRYMQEHDIKRINAQTLLPYAVVMGPSVFHQIVSKQLK